MILNSCSSGNTNEANMYTGVIQPAGITSYQYGTHTLQTIDSLYAIKSDSIDLQPFETKEVTIQANKIDGYPVDGGPVYLNVLEVKD